MNKKSVRACAVLSPEILDPVIIFTTTKFDKFGRLYCISEHWGAHIYWSCIRPAQKRFTSVYKKLELSMSTKDVS